MMSTGTFTENKQPLYLSPYRKVGVALDDEAEVRAHGEEHALLIVRDQPGTVVCIFQKVKFPKIYIIIMVILTE